MCAGSPTLVKQKNPVLPFSRRKRPFWQKILIKLVAECDQTCSCKIRSLRFHKQKNEKETPQTEHPFIDKKTSLLYIVLLLGMRIMH